MNKPYLVGITGGIGSGKSTVAGVFRLLGVPVYDADTQAKRLMIEDTDLVHAIKNSFGQKAYAEGNLNRQYLAERVFSSDEATARLNSLVHPAVAQNFENWAMEQRSAYVLKEAALLFETGSYKELDRVILITAPEELRIARVQKRDPQRSIEQIKNIIDKQINESEARTLADDIIANDGASLVIPHVIQLDEKIKRAIR